MVKSTEFFKGRAFDVFDTSEVNEMMLTIYIELGYAIRDNCDSIELNRKALVRTSKDRITGEFSMLYDDTSVYDVARRSLLKILERDSVVQKFFQLAEVDQDKIKIKVNAADSTSP